MEGQGPGGFVRRWRTQARGVWWEPPRPMRLGVWMVDYRAIWHLADGSYCQTPRGFDMWSVEIPEVTARESLRRIRYWRNRVQGAFSRERLDLADRALRAAVTNVGDYQVRGRRAEASRRAWRAAADSMGVAVRYWQDHPSRYAQRRVLVMADRMRAAYAAVERAVASPHR